MVYYCSQTTSFLSSIEPECPLIDPRVGVPGGLLVHNGKADAANERPRKGVKDNGQPIGVIARSWPHIDQLPVIYKSG